uniref:rRNA-processing protein EFG1 n=2 Tax=Caenorhabditis tropicalis TaxID=1561998 RepID=A0A1I7TLP6_9PELO
MRKQMSYSDIPASWFGVTDFPEDFLEPDEQTTKAQSQPSSSGSFSCVKKSVKCKDICLITLKETGKIETIKRGTLDKLLIGETPTKLYFKIEPRREHDRKVQERKEEVRRKIEKQLRKAEKHTKLSGGSKKKQQNEEIKDYDDPEEIQFELNRLISNLEGNKRYLVQKPVQARKLPKTIGRVEKTF